MFGMKDYRAHNLLWLLASPIRLLATIAFFAASILVPMYVVAKTQYGPLNVQLMQIALAYIAFEGVMMLVATLLFFISSGFERFFTFFIDVEMSVGRTPEEAKLVLRRGGEYVKLESKMVEHIEDWDI